MNISPTIISLVDKLYIAEGSTLHMNKNEKDITSAGGIYRYAHPDAKIWSYVDEVARSIGITSRSNIWTNDEIIRIDTALDKNKIKELVCQFYEGYTRGAKLELFPSKLAYTLFNIYANTPYGYWVAVQETIIDMNEIGVINLPKDKVSIADGKPGSKTYESISAITKLDNKDLKYFQALLCSNMKSWYVKLMVSNPDKYLAVVKGWINRMDHLEREVSTWS